MVCGFGAFLKSAPKVFHAGQTAFKSILQLIDLPTQNMQGNYGKHPSPLLTLDTQRMPSMIYKQIKSTKGNQQCHAMLKGL